MPNPKDFDLTSKEGRAMFRSAVAEEYPEPGRSSSAEEDNACQIKIDNLVARYGYENMLKALIVNVQNAINLCPEESDDDKVIKHSYVLEVLEEGLHRTLMEFQDV